MRTLVHLLDLVELTEARGREEAVPMIDELLALNARTQLLDDTPYRLLRRGVVLWQKGGNDQQALEIIKQAIAEFDRLEHPIPRLLIDLAPLYNRLHQSQERYAYFRDKLAYYRLHNSLENTASCYLVISGYFRHMGAYNQAISYSLRAADLFKQFDPKYHVNELMVAGSLYADWGNAQKALQYLGQAMALEDKYGVEGLQRFYTVQSLSKVYLQEGELTDALRYANLNLQEVTQAQNPLQKQICLAYALVQKSAVTIALGRPQEALPMLQRAQYLADSLQLRISGRPGEFLLDATWAKYYQATRQAGQAEQHWRRAYTKATAGRLKILRYRVLRDIIGFYAAQQKPAQVQQYTELYLALTDSMHQEQSAFLVAQYEGERVEQAQNTRIAALQQAQAIQELHLRQRNRLLVIALLAVVLVSGLGVFLYRQLHINKRTLAQLRQTQNQLVAAEKWAFVGEVSAGIAHELQNPLNFMKRFAEVSTTMIDGMPQQGAHAHNGQPLQQEILAGLKKNLQEISQHGLRASSIIKDMLEHSRSGTGQREATDLNALAAEYLRLAYEGVQTQDPNFRATLTTDFDASLGEVQVVPPDLGRVLLNLLTNAFFAVRKRQHLSPGNGYQPEVRISTRRTAAGVEVRVRDNGTGMPEAVRQRVFEPFFTTKAVGEGTGLGLSLSHDIVTKGHGGNISVESKEGHYTEFVITLPA
ncbi:ATP-binding protein [Hymenobacter latericus]|uniref:ATP-binding protein n=1 Tax=Hymenobacter sp. YIM 151858-1 TaxID=2987688 RepID=UPI0022264373|nr:ATP-binding protein [Hymenobacter sp. YIM 151858-1]UYZ59702.1 ATP-binding protein [Hymenobacter sp. YIM 151858-1]